MNSKLSPDFDTWMNFYLENEGWLLNAIFFHEDRFPYDKASVVTLILNEADEAKRSGVFEMFQDSYLLHIGLVLKFRHPAEDYPLRARRLQIHAALIETKSSEHAQDYLKSIGSDWLEQSPMELRLIEGFLDEAKEICQRGGLDFGRFVSVNKVLVS
jgi:hypothetical protein